MAGDPQLARSTKSWIRSNKPFSSPVEKKQIVTPIAGAAGTSHEQARLDAFAKTTKDFNWGNHVDADDY